MPCAREPIALKDDFLSSVSASLRIGGREGDRASASFQRSLADTLYGKQDALTSPEIVQAVAHANSLAEHHMLGDGICARDWSQPCPDGWELVGASACRAPNSYRGGCGRLQRFGSASLPAKANFAVNCKAPWPCSGADECTQ